MKKAIIGKKVGMTQIFDETGKVIPVTVIEAGPCVVVQKMTKEKEGYEAVQFGYEEVTEKKLTKPEKGHLEKAGVGMVKHLKEFRLEDSAKLEVGDVIKADMFAEGDKVDVTGTSKGHGYAGVPTLSELSWGTWNGRMLNLPMLNSSPYSIFFLWLCAILHFMQ